MTFAWMLETCVHGANVAGDMEKVTLGLMAAMNQVYTRRDVWRMRSDVRTSHEQASMMSKMTAVHVKELGWGQQ